MSELSSFLEMYQNDIPMEGFETPSDTPSSTSDLSTFLKQYEADMPLEAPSKYNILGGIKDVGKLIYDIPVNVLGAAASFWEDDNPEAEHDWKDIWRREQAERTAQRAAEPGREEYVVPGIKRGDISNVGSSTGFSGAAMLGGIVGGIAASPIPLPGARVASALAGSGATSYRINKANFTQQIIDAARQDNPDITPEEVAKIVEDTKELRTKHSLWEAIPEAAGNVAQLSGIGALFKAGLGKKLGARLFKAVAGMYGLELATETITQTGQHNVEIEAGLAEGEKRSFASWDDMTKSLGEVAPGVFILVSLTGGAGAVAGKSYQLITNPKAHADSSAIDPIVAKFNSGEINLETALSEVVNANVSEDTKRAATEFFRKTTSNQKEVTGSPIEDPGTDTFEKDLTTEIDELITAGDMSLSDIKAHIKTIKKDNPGQAKILREKYFPKEVAIEKIKKEKAAAKKERATKLKELTEKAATKEKLVEEKPKEEIKADVPATKEKPVEGKSDEEIKADAPTTKEKPVEGKSDEEIKADAPTTKEKPVEGKPKEEIKADVPAKKEEPTQKDVKDIDLKDVEAEPSEAQKEAGNYKKAHLKIQGLDISVENPQGSTRSGTDQKGKAWSIKMKDHYGYFKRSEGKDGDQVDIFINPDKRTKKDKAYIVDQADPSTGKFDEHKVMIGYPTAMRAKQAYNRNYAKGWKGLSAMTEVSLDDLKSWLAEGKQTKPYAVIPEKPPETKKETPREKAQETAPTKKAPETKKKETLKEKSTAKKSIKEIGVGIAKELEKEGRSGIAHANFIKHTSYLMSLPGKRSIPTYYEWLGKKQIASPEVAKKLAKEISSETDIAIETDREQMRKYRTKSRQRRLAAKDKGPSLQTIKDKNLKLFFKKSGEGLDSVRKKWADKGIKSFMSEQGELIRVADIIVPKGKRKQGLGSTAMRELADYADMTNQRITLSPSKDFGATSVGRLKDFYKRFGFIENRGKYKDHTISDSMYREPRYKYSKAKKKSVKANSVEQVLKEIKSHLKPRAIKDLIESGKVNIVSTEADVEIGIGPYAPGETRGFYDSATDKAYIIANNIQKGEAWGVLLHELGSHAGLKKLLGARYSDVEAEVKRLLDSKDGAMVRAAAKVPKDTPSDVVIEEVIAYFSELSANQNHPLFKRIASAIKIWAFKTGITTKLEPVDIAMLVRGAVRREAKLAAKDIASFKKWGEVATETKKVPTKESKILYSKNEIAEVWRSQMADFISEKLSTGPAVQTAQTLESWAKKGLIKSEELEWSGVVDWLNEQKGKVTKEAVLDYIKLNNVQVEEVFKTNESEQPSAEEAAYGLFLDNFDLEEYLYESIVEESEKIWEDPEHRAWKFLDAKEEYLDSANGNVDEAKELFGDDVYGLEAGVVLGDEVTEEATSEAWSDVKDDYISQVQAGETSVDLDDLSEIKYESLKLEGGKDYKELLLKLPEGEFKSAHWDELGVLAHVRFDTRENADGNRTLHMAEFQSDWHQEGRKEGYRVPYEREELSIVDPKSVDETPLEKGVYWYIKAQDQQYQVARSDQKTAKDALEYVLKNKFKEGRVPDAPFKKTWPLLVLKRMARYAAENDFDTLSWDTGKTSADRYDLRKYIDTVMYATDGSGVLKAFDSDGKVIFEEKRINEEKLADYLGADIAKKLLSQKSRVANPGSRREIGYRPSVALSGLELKTGGEGMIAFYDKILPSIANKFFGKAAWGNAEVQKSKVKSEDYTTADAPDTIIIGTEESWQLPVTPRMKNKSLKEGMPLFSKNSMGVSKETDSYFSTEKNTLQKITDKMANASWQKFKKFSATNLVDRLNPIKILGNESYMLHRMQGNIASQMAAFLQHGLFKWEGNGLAVEKSDDGGFLSWYRDLKKDGPKFLQWVAAKRAAELSKPTKDFPKGRENYLTEDKRNAIFEETWTPDDKHANQLNEQFQKFNNNILDIAEEAGVINKKGRAEWQQEFYIPFYRMINDEAILDGAEILAAPSKIKRHIKSGIKQLKGGESELGDPMENILRNWTHLINESMRNQSRSHAFEAAKKIGMARVVPKKFIKMSDRKTLSYLKDGEPVYFQVSDAELFNALSEFNHEHLDGIWAKMFGDARHLLTWGVTMGPAFRVANFLRDTLSTGVVSPHFVPILDSFRGMAKIIRKHPEYIAYAGSGGAFTQGYVRGHDPDAHAESVKKLSKGRSKNILKAAYNAWQYIGDVSEMSARVQLYSNLKKKGSSHLEASFEAKDIMDFTMKGAAKSMTSLTNIIPFMNARMQGMYKLGRAAKASPVSFLTKGSLLTIASMALWSIWKDDERYKQLPDEEKWLYHNMWVGDEHIRIPKGFEVGLMFSSVFEEAGNIWNESEEGKHFLDFLSHAWRETLSMQIWLPQLVKPAFEVLANKNTFTGRDIEGMGLRNLSPGKRYQPWTPEALKALGEKTGLPPLKVQHMLRGYLGSMGAGLIIAADLAYTSSAELPDRPSMAIDQYPLVGRFVRGERVKRTKYNPRVWEMFDELSKVNSDLNRYRKDRQHDKVRAFQKKKRKELRAYNISKPYRSQLDNIRAQMMNIWANKNLSSEQKDEKLLRLEKKRNKVHEKAYRALNEKLR